MDDETLREYIDRYQKGGIDAPIKTHYFGCTCFLSDAQQKILCGALEQDIFLTCASVNAYIEKNVGVTCSTSRIRDLLHRLGYEYKKPKWVPGNPDEDAQAVFAEKYECFMEEKPIDEEVIFVDAVRPEHNTLAAYGGIKRGQKRKLQTNSGRQRLNLHGANNIETFTMTVIESKTIDGDSTVELLEALNQKYLDSRRLHIILDNARYQCSKTVKNYLSSNERINLVFLPAYSPELNLIERVWLFFKKKVQCNKYYPDLKSFR